MQTEKIRISSGVGGLDRILGGLFIGDNVIWYDDVGSLAAVFYMNFIQASQALQKPLIYVSFDRSPRNVIETLEAFADNPNLIVLDCFSFGKGTGSDVFLDFYKKKSEDYPCRIIQVKEPQSMDRVMETLYEVHGTLEGDVRFVFESLTGMQELWGEEEQILKFYSQSCPRLYELNTIAYWVIEKQAHSSRLRAHINKIAQVAIELSLKRGKTSLTVLKADRRQLESLNKPLPYWYKGLEITFDLDGHTTGKLDLGKRLRELRSKRGISQTELARLVGVTPSTISQVESNQIYPSLPALIKMAEILAVDVSTFFKESAAIRSKVVFQEAEAVQVSFPELPRNSAAGKLLTPLDLNPRAEPFLIEIPPGKTIPSHLFIHKGEELGYVLSGKLRFKIHKAAYEAGAGDLIYLTNEIPTEWKNPGPDTARLLWIKVK